MRILSGITDQYVYFVAVDATDLKTRETGLSSFTVYRSRNGAATVAMTTPPINDVSSSNMPGVYEFLLDEDMTIGSNNVSEDMVFHVTRAGMNAVTLGIELYDFNNFDPANDAVANVTLVATTTTNTDMRGTNCAATVSALATVDSNVDAILTDTGPTLPSSLSGIETKLDTKSL